MISHYDVIVIGGGIAGLSTAANITEGNVLLIERDKIKTEQERHFRIPYGELPGEFGLKSCFLNTYDTIYFLTFNNSILEVPYPNEDLHLLDLGKVNHILKKHVYKNHECKENILVKNVKVDNKMIYVEIFNKKNNENTNLSAKYLVDASGINFLTRTIFNLQTPDVFLHYLASTFKGGYNSDSKVVTFIYPSTEFKSGGWIFPYAQNNYNFGIGKTFYDIKSSIRMLKDKFYSAHTHYTIKDKINGGQRGKWTPGILPLGISEPMVFERVIYVGDVVGQTTPWGLEGIRPIMESSIMCANALNSTIKHDDKNLLKKYENDWNDTYGKIYRLIDHHEKWYNRITEDWDRSIERMKIVLENDLAFLHSALKYDRMPKHKQKYLKELRPNWI